MKYFLGFSVLCLSAIFQNCGAVNFSASPVGLNGGGAVGGTVGGTVGGNGVTVGLPANPEATLTTSAPTTAPEQMNLICNFQGVVKTDWDQTSVNNQLPNYSISHQSTGVDIKAANEVDIENNSGQDFIVESAEHVKQFSNNSGNLVANARNVCTISNDSGSIDLNSTNVGEITSSSSDHICVSAHTIKSLSHFSSGNVALSSDGVLGSLSTISSSSSGKLVLINFNVDSITAGSGNIYIKGGHIKLISNVSGNLYLDNVTIDQLSSSSGNIYLSNRAKVLVRN